LYCKALIPPEKRPKAYKVKARTKPRKLLTVLKFKTYLVYIPTRNTVTKTPFIKLYKPKNPLTLKKVSKLTEIRPLTDVAVTKNSTGKRISLNLLKIDDINSSEPITLETPRSLKPLELLAPRPFKPLKLETSP